MATINYDDAPATWRTVRTSRKDGSVTEQEQATIRFKVQVGVDELGKPKYATRRKSKLFPPDASLDTDRKRSNALKKWKKELRDEDARAESLALKRKQEAEEVARLEAERKQREDEEKARLEAQKSDPSYKSVGDFVSEYVDSLSLSGTIERSTANAYRGAARHIADGFGDITIRELTSPMIQAWQNQQLADGYSAGTVIKWHRVLSQSLRFAVDTDVIEKNPCRAVRAPKKAAPTPNSLSESDYARLANTLISLEPSQVVTAAYIALSTGLRCGEVCGIRWREYDASSKTINVVESIGAAGGDYVKQPKTAASKRVVPVPNGLARVLDNRRRYMESQLEEFGITFSESDFGALYICGYPDGRFYSPTRCERDFKALAESFGLAGVRGRRMTMHGLRDSFATVAIKRGVDVRSVSAMLGHNSPLITLTAYADCLPEGKRGAVNTLNTLVEDGSGMEPFAELAD